MFEREDNAEATNFDAVWLKTVSAPDFLQDLAKLLPAHFAEREEYSSPCGTLQMDAAWSRGDAPEYTAALNATGLWF